MNGSQRSNERKKHHGLTRFSHRSTIGRRSASEILLQHTAWKSNRNRSDISKDYMDVCSQYLDVATFAEQLVDDIIKEAESFLDPKRPLYKYPSIISSEEQLRSLYSEEYIFVDPTKQEFTSWPCIKDFTIELGASKINEYLCSFFTEEEWVYAIYYLKTKKESQSDMYEYEAIWSLPTAPYPIAQATASVFFTIEVSKVLPPNCLVKVKYKLETNRFQHQPDLSVFNEQWLNFILDAKIEFFKTVRY